MRFAVHGLAILAAVGLAVPVIADDASQTAGQKSLAHVEACSHNGWGYLTFAKYHFGTTNMCAEPVTVWFMLKSGRIVHQDVAPRGIFDSGLVKGDFDEEFWAAAVCPQGHRPEPPVTLANWDTIQRSHYKCVAGP